MTNGSVEALERELLLALSKHDKSEEALRAATQKYRSALFGSNYKNPEAEEDSCSFCAKAEKEIEQFVSGANARICNECIELSYDLIRGNK